MVEIKRDVYPLLLKEFSRREITILIGARQVGKTFLLKKLERHARSVNLRVRYLDLEQPENALLLNRSESDIIATLTKDLDVLLLDEFYYLKNSSHILKAIYDRGTKVKIFASGSSSMEIHRHMKESLAGRKRIYFVNPCGLQEMSQVWGKKTLAEIMRFGGMPGIAHCQEEDRIRLLADILQSYVLKDVKSLIREENIRAFNHLLYLIAEHQGNVTAVANLAREIGLSAATVENYLSILTQTRVLFPLFSFSRNLGNELKKSRKYYLYDTGICNMLLKDFRAPDKRPDGGFILESFIFHELNRRLDPLSEIRFWRTRDGKEVDLILIRNRIPFPIEVKSTISANEVPAGIQAFIRRYPTTPLAVILNPKLNMESQWGKTKIFYLKLEEVDQVPDLAANV